MKRSRALAILVSLVMLASSTLAGVSVAMGSRAKAVRPSPTQIARNRSTPTHKLRTSSTSVSVGSTSVRVMAALDDTIPGVPIPPSPVADSLDTSTDPDDVFAINLAAGERLTASLTGTTGTDFDLWLYDPSASELASFSAIVADASTLSYPDILTSGDGPFFDVPPGLGGTYYLDVHAFSGAGTYTVTYAVTTPATDDNIPGVALPASPFSGTLSDLSDPNDVFFFALAEGEEFKVAMTDSGFPTGHPQLFLYPPGASDVTTDPQIAWSKRGTGQEDFTFVVPPGGAGTYYLDHFAPVGVGAGTYTTSWSVDSDTVVRLFGDNRYSTNQAASRSAFTSATTAVLATGGNFADALSASGLAGAYNAPLILTPTNELSDDAAMELFRLGVTDVIIVGGPPAISTDVADLLSVSGYNVTRVGGADRYLTAAAVAAKIFDKTGSTPEAFVVRGDAFADALAAAPLAYKMKMPILLTRPTQLPVPTSSYITSAGVTSVVIAGSSSAVSNGVMAAIDALAGVTSVQRAAGATRYETARAVADFGVAQGWSTYGYVGVATGENFPDGLTAGSTCGSRGGVLLLTTPTTLSTAASNAISTNSGTITRVGVFGGPPAVSDGAMNAIKALLP